MIYELVPNTDTILREVMPKFDFSKPEIDPIELSRNMVESLRHYGGLGLAAPQVGLRYRMFVMDTHPAYACFNPIIVDAASELIELDEGCLSFRGLLIKVKRPRLIKVRFALPTGEIQTHTWNDMTARIFQHELDHLNGKVIWNNLSRLKLEMARKKARKRGLI